jgi:phosphopentomutase
MEQTLYRAVILQLFIDAISTNSTRQENIIARIEARFFVIKEREEFIEICDKADISYKVVEKKFFDILHLSKKHDIVFLDYNSIIKTKKLPKERKKIVFSI